MFIRSKKIISLAGLGFLLALTPNIASAAKEVEMPASATGRTNKPVSRLPEASSGLVFGKPVSENRTAFRFKACGCFEWFGLNWCRTLVVYV